MRLTSIILIGALVFNSLPYSVFAGSLACHKNRSIDVVDPEQVIHRDDSNGAVSPIHGDSENKTKEITSQNQIFVNIEQKADLATHLEAAKVKTLDLDGFYEIITGRLGQTEEMTLDEKLERLVTLFKDIEETDRIPLLYSPWPVAKKGLNMFRKFEYSYNPNKMIAKGKYGRVYVATKMDPETGQEKEYAIKKFIGYTDALKYQRMLSEFVVGSSLHHANTVKTFDLIQDQERSWFLVMEYLPKGCLLTPLLNKNHKFSTDEVNNYFVQLVRSVAYMHSMGVAHMDLKPENVLIDENNNLKIADFGLIKVFDLNAPKAFGKRGSRFFIAPELHMKIEYDPRAVDIFTLGVLYSVLITKGFFWEEANDTDEDYMKSLKSGHPFINELPEGYRDLIRQIYNPNPVERITMDGILNNPWFQKMDSFMQSKQNDSVMP